MAELIGVKFKHSKVQNHFPDIVETLTTLPTLHTTCKCCLWLSQFQLCVLPKRWPGGSGVDGALVQSHTYFSCTCGGGWGRMLYIIRQLVYNRQERKMNCVCVHAARVCVCAFHTIYYINNE